MIQSAKFTSNATAIAHLLCLIFEDSKQPTLRMEQKAGSEFANHPAFGPTVKEPQSDTGVHLVEHPGGHRLKVCSQCDAHAAVSSWWRAIPLTVVNSG
jgi:hypothetical protein